MDAIPDDEDEAEYVVTSAGGVGGISIRGAEDLTLLALSTFSAIAVRGVVDEVVVRRDEVDGMKGAQSLQASSSEKRRL